MEPMQPTNEIPAASRAPGIPFCDTRPAEAATEPTGGMPTDALVRNDMAEPMPEPHYIAMDSGGYWNCGCGRVAEYMRWFDTQYQVVMTTVADFRCSDPTRASAAALKAAIAATESRLALLRRIEATE